jgi:hypothetical protein
VFDHGHNDNWFFVTGTDEPDTIPSSYKDRTYFIGAMNFLIDLILQDNPRARICFIGHYENDRKAQISVSQGVLAEYWDFPLFKTWEKLGWSQKQVTTTGYWGSDGIWVASGGSSQSLTMTQIWMKDNLHPHSDLSNNALNQYAKTISPWLDMVR